MKITIDPELFNDKNNYENIDTIFVMLRSGRHELFIKEAADIRIIRGSEWHIKIRDSLGQFASMFLEGVYKNEAYKRTEPNVKIIQKGIEPTLNEYPFEEALILLQNTIEIIVENEIYDKHFIDSLLNNFQNTSKIKKAFEKRWIRYRHAGGKNNITNIINVELDKFKNYSKQPKDLIRLFVIIDSDKKSHVQVSPNLYIKEYCDNLEIPCHILSKREMENYIPVEAIETLRETHLEIVNSYLNLNDIQKDYYDLEKGFGTNRKNLHDDVSELFKDVHDKDFENLKNGFYKKDFYPKQHLPLLFSNPKVSTVTLKNRTHGNTQNELQSIVDTIGKLL